jgi:hypothetical protein
VRLLSPVEQTYLNGTREFTKTQQRYIRYRLRKKLRLADEQSCAAAAGLLRLEEGKGEDSLVRIAPTPIGIPIGDENEKRARRASISGPAVIFTTAVATTTTAPLAAVPKTAAIS